MANKGHRFFGPLWDLVARLNSGGEFSRRRRLNVRDGTNTLAALVDAPQQNELQLSWSVPTVGGAGSGHGAGVVPDPGATVHNQQWPLLDTGSFAPIRGGVYAWTYVATDQSTASATDVELATPDSATFTLDQSANLGAFYTAMSYNGTAGDSNATQCYLDGVAQGSAQSAVSINANSPAVTTLFVLMSSVAAGTHTISFRHHAGGGTAHFIGRSTAVFILP